jgi:hypothetical protein
MTLCCIYSRHYDGFVREKYIRLLLAMDYEEWAIPFIVKICDEYVVDILTAVYVGLQGRNTQGIKNFCLENPDESRKSYDRMVSYWNAYYRGNRYLRPNQKGYHPLNKYIGIKLFRECFGVSRHGMVYGDKLSKETRIYTKC